MRDLQKEIGRGREIVRENVRKDMTAYEMQSLMNQYDARLREMDARSALMLTLADSYLLGLATDTQPKRHAS